MSYPTLMEKLRNFLGIRQEVPRNEFRNPIWGSDDDDDGDELYSRDQMDVYDPTADMQQELTRHMQDMFKSFGSMFTDIQTLFHDDDIRKIDAFTSIPDVNDPDQYNNDNIRDYYLKPGYHSRKHEDYAQEDVDLDGKISSSEISGLLKQNGKKQNDVTSFNGNLVPGRSFCQTIITTSVTKADGTTETRRIVKNGNEVIEETTTTAGPGAKGPVSPTSFYPIAATGIIFSELANLIKNYY